MLKMHLAFRSHLAAIFHSVMRFWRTVVECPEPLVPWHFEIAVIHLKIPMVHLMMKCAQRKGFAILDQQRFIPRVRGCSRQRLMLHMKQDM